MKSAKWIFFLIFFISLLAAGYSLFIRSIVRTTASESAPLQNELRAFTSDGCSRFPDGIPYLNEKKWLKCCVVHDVAYWQGGAAAQREAADLALKNCVAQTGEIAIANAMYAGVRVGGHEALPTSWRWGYGWVIDRGDAELSDVEKNQVLALQTKIPANLDEMQIQSAPIIPPKDSVTGNYCFDAGVKQVEVSLGRAFRLKKKTEDLQQKFGGWWKTLNLTVEGCEDPFQFTFFLLKADACEIPADELTARSQIWLVNLIAPKSCQKPK